MVKETCLGQVVKSSLVLQITLPEGSVRLAGAGR